MDAIAVTYLQALAGIGDKLEKITANFNRTSQEFVNKPNKTVNDLRQAKSRYKVLCVELTAQESALSKLNPHGKLAQLHADLLNAIRNYNKSVNDTAESINEMTLQIDTDKLERGINGQKQYAQEINAISDAMVKKMTE